MSKSAALFGGPQQPAAKHLLQFRAGKMTIDNNNWVHADPRRGWVYVYQSGDGKLHFCWIDRETRLVEENFVIGAKQAEFKKVPQCTTGRVYLLKLKNAQRFFVWMQEPNRKNDNNICSRINEFISSPPAQMNTPTDWLNTFEGFNNLSRNDLLALLSMSVGLGSGLSSESDVSSAQANAVVIGRHLNSGHLEGQAKADPPALAQSAARAGAITTSSNASKRGDKGKIQLQDLRNILSSISKSTTSVEPNIDLSDTINATAVRDLLERPDVQSRLSAHLPAITPSSSSAAATTQSSLITNVQSSEFASTLKSFSAAFQTGSLGPALSQFQLEPNAVDAAKRGDLLAFARALESNANPSSQADNNNSRLPESTPAPTGSSQPTPKPKDPESKDRGNDDVAMDTD